MITEITSVAVAIITLLGSFLAWRKKSIEYREFVLKKEQDKDREEQLKINIRRHPIFDIFDRWRTTKQFELEVQGSDKKTKMLRDFVVMFIDSYEKAIKENIDFYEKHGDIELNKFHTDAINLILESAKELKLPDSYVNKLFFQLSRTMEVISQQIRIKQVDETNVYGDSQIKKLYDTISDLSAHIDMIIENFKQVALLLNGTLDSYLDERYPN